MVCSESEVVDRLEQNHAGPFDHANEPCLFILKILGIHQKDSEVGRWSQKMALA